MNGKLLATAVVILVAISAANIIDSGVLGRMWDQMFQSGAVTATTRSGARLTIRQARALHAEDWMGAYPAHRKDFLRKISFLESQLNDPQASNSRIKLLTDALDHERGRLAERRPQPIRAPTAPDRATGTQAPTFGEMVGEPLFDDRHATENR